MLIDNKNQYEVEQPKTLYEFFSQNLQNGNFNVVSGFFSISMLANFHKNFQQLDALKMVLGNLTDNEKNNKARIDLLSTSPSIIGTFELSSQAKKAVEFLQQDKLQVKTYVQKFCHAKAYIYDNAKRPNDSFFSLGSSNFTHAGLKDTPNSNIELNFAKTGRDADFKEIMKWFAQLWEESASEITIDKDTKQNYKKYIITLIEKLFFDYTPEHLYYKILFELFYEQLLQESSEANQKKLTHLKETQIWNRLFDFQQKGVLSLIRMLQNFNGAILADAVGLGKTWSALAVMKFFEMEGYKTILLCPKKLENNWERYKSDNGSLFDTDEFRYVVRYHTDLQGTRLEKKEPLKTLSKFFQNNAKILLVIDESHNLRNDKSSRYEFLVKDILNKQRESADIKVLLLSATPINTKLTDIRNQFKLIVKGSDTGFREKLQISSLEILFGQAQKKFNEWQKEQTNVLADFIGEVPENFFRLTDALVVARTRKMIEKHLNKDLFFPKKEKPINCYHLPKGFGKLTTAESIIQALENLHFWGYQPAKFIKSEAEWKKGGATENEFNRQGFLAKMMFFLLIKRLESSWHSFHTTLKNILAHHENALNKITAFIENRHLKSEQAEMDFTPKVSEEDLEAMGEGNEDTKKFSEEIEQYTLGKSKPISLADIKDIGKFRKELEAEVKKLTELAQNVGNFKENFGKGTQQDDKLVELVKQIKDKRTKRSNRKILIFTVFKDTAKYLYENLQAHFEKENIAYISGDESESTEGYKGKKFEPLLEQFAPYTKLFNEGDWFDDAFLKYKKLKPNELTQEQKEEERKKVSFDEWKAYIKAYKPSIQAKLDQPIDLLIATDCLSEGQNLQDCDCVVNYDIHWNPVRLIQRFGRIDRIGSPNLSIMGISFWIGQSYENALNLKNRVEKRMAIMALAGTETMDTLTPSMEQMMQNNPLVSEQEEKMLKQMLTSWDDIETGSKTLSLADFSLEIFRQELLAYMLQNKQFLLDMPNAVFSGFQKSEQDTTQGFTSRNLLALLKHKTSKQYHLLLTNEQGKSIFVNHYFVLQFLSKYKNEKRLHDEKIGFDNADILKMYAEILGKNLLGESQEQATKDLKAAAKQGFGAMKLIGTAENATNKYYENENFELIVWETITSI